MAWSDPDLRKQVIVDQPRLGDFVPRFQFINTGEETKGKYKFVYAGQFVATEVPDISLDTIMENMDFLINQMDVFEMEKQLDFNVYKAVYTLYTNVTLAPILLTLNKIFANLYFTSDNINVFEAPRENVLTSYISKLITSKSPVAAHEIKQPKQLKELVDYFKSLATYITSVEGIAALKIGTVPDEYFAGIEDQPLYKRLVNELGEDKVNSLLTLLDKFIKMGNGNND